MTVIADAHCFVCGQDNPIGLKARFAVDEQAHSASCTLRLPAEFQGWQEVVHGGIIASLLDEACIYACRTISEKVVTAELSLRYRRPVPVDAEVAVQAQVTQRNRRTMSVTARLTIGETVHATAKTKVFVLR